MTTQQTTKDHSSLAKFRNGWPVRDWIQQYLRNFVNDQKHRLKVRYHLRFDYLRLYYYFGAGGHSRGLRG